MNFILQLNMSSVVQDSNEKHLAPWSEACSADNIVNTPLSPYLDKVISFFHKGNCIFHDFFCFCDRC